MKEQKRREDKKESYDRVSCRVAEVETQGVLCASIGEEDEDLTGLTGGLKAYTGSAL